MTVKRGGNLVYGLAFLGVSWLGFTNGGPIVRWLRGMLELASHFIAAGLYAVVLAALVWLGLMGLMIAAGFGSDRVTYGVTIVAASLGLLLFFIGLVA